MNSMYDHPLFEDADALLGVNERRRRYSFENNGDSPAESSAFRFQPPQKREKPYTVSEINGGLGRIIESGNTLVWVEGELSGFKRASSGHCYLRLKDEASQIPGVLWKQTATQLRFEPKDGMQSLPSPRSGCTRKAAIISSTSTACSRPDSAPSTPHFSRSRKTGEGRPVLIRRASGPCRHRHHTRRNHFQARRGAFRYCQGRALARSPHFIVVIDVPVQGEAAAPQSRRRLPT